jgi:polysaccharide biosynthesis transport protein
MRSPNDGPPGGGGPSWPWAIRKNLYIVRSRIQVLVVVAIVCLAGAIVADFLYPKMYTSTARLVTQPTVDTASPVEQNAQPLVDSLNYMETQIEVVQSAALLRTVVEQNGLDTRLGDISTPIDMVQGLIGAGRGGVSPKEANTERAVDLMSNRVKAVQVKDSFVLEISVASTDPALSRQLAASVATQYLRTSQGSKLRNLESSEKALNAQLKQQESNVKKATDALQAFDRANDPANRQVTTTTGSGSNQTATQADPPLRAQRTSLELTLENEQERYTEVAKSLDRIKLQEGLAKNEVDTSDLLDKPAEPTTPDGLSSKYRIALYVVLSVLVGLACCYALHYWDLYRRSLPAMVSRLS